MKGFFGLCVALVLLASPAMADTGTVGDEDNPWGPNDIQSVSHGHEQVSGRVLLTHTLTMYEAWDTPGSMRFIFEFKENGRRRAAQLEVGQSPDGTLYAEMIRGVRVVGYARIWRPDDRSVAVAFPRSLLGRKLTAYKWFASTVYADDPGEEPGSCPQNSGDVIVQCEDNSAFLRHRLQ